VGSWLTMLARENKGKLKSYKIGPFQIILLMLSKYYFQINKKYLNHIVSLRKEKHSRINDSIVFFSAIGAGYSHVVFEQ
jgi:hypothetical protein